MTNEFVHSAIVSLFLAGHDRSFIEETVKLDCAEFSVDDEETLNKVGNALSIARATASSALLDAYLARGFTRDEAITLIAFNSNK